MPTFVFLYQVQLISAPAPVSHRHLQGKGGTAPEASLLMGAVPAQGAPGEQGPAGGFIMLSCMNKFCVKKILHVSIRWKSELRLFFCPLSAHLCSYPISSAAHTLISFSKSKSPVVCAAHFQRSAAAWKANTSEHESRLLCWSRAQHRLQLKTLSSLTLLHCQRKYKKCSHDVKAFYVISESFISLWWRKSYVIDTQ